MSAAPMPARARACSMAMRAPLPAGSGADMWYPSDDSPQPCSATAAGSFVIRNRAAPSPILMPWRFALIGLQRSALTDSRAEKPATVKAHRESAPPVRTASTRPILIRRAALAMALALDEHALEWA